MRVCHSPHSLTFRLSDIKYPNTLKTKVIIQPIIRPFDFEDMLIMPFKFLPTLQKFTKEVFLLASIFEQIS